MTQDQTTASSSTNAPILEQAALWRAQLECGSADREAFARWRDADPRHAIAFAKISGLWEGLGEAAFPDAGAVPASNPAVESSTRLEHQHTGLTRRRFAALLAGAMTVGGSAFIARESLAREQAQTRTGERRTLNLARARLEMNTDTRLQWRAAGSETKIWLCQGEVAMHIRAGSMRHSLEAAVCAASLTAGIFNARHLHDVLELTVLQGAAEFRSRVTGKLLRVGVGERVLATTEATTLQQASAETTDAIEAWQRGEIVFHDTQLAAAIAEYNRYLERKLVILDPQVARLRIGGRFTSMDPTLFLQALHDAFAVKAVYSQDVTVLVNGA